MGKESQISECRDKPGASRLQEKQRFLLSWYADRHTVIRHSLRARERLCFNLSPSAELCIPAPQLVEGKGILLRGYWGVAELAGNGLQRSCVFLATCLSKWLCVFGNWWVCNK